MAWITLVATPVLILLQGQVTFLPYHREWVVWLQRVAVLIDLALIWYFWIAFAVMTSRSDGGREKPRCTSVAWGLFAWAFSAYISDLSGRMDEKASARVFVVTRAAV